MADVPVLIFCVCLIALIKLIHLIGHTICFVLLFKLVKDF